MYEWLIVGGGIQGCTMASYLLKEKKIPVTNLAIVDAHSTPLATWKRCTNAIEMPYLRSPSIHHLDPDPFALEKFAKTTEGRKLASFVLPYDRPGLQFFNTHCDHLFDEINLEDCWVQGKVNGLKRQNNHWTLSLEDGAILEGKNVVLAIGLSEQPNWPDWAKELKQQNIEAYHVFERNQVSSLPSEETVVIGGGISAAHTALKLSKQSPGKVTLITRHPLRAHQFDSDPGWLGPKNMNHFRKIKSYEERRKVIKEARYRGSMPSELKTKLVKAKNEGRLQLCVDHVLNISTDTHFFELELEQTEQIVTGNKLYVATGFIQSAPGLAWLQDTIQKHELRCASCGYPIVTPSLQWKEELFTLGALAELEIGPVARNISGARRGAERIIHAL
ncbi:NAD(P)-binding domain-containing protein [Bacillus sp. FJAT-45350]|uniref:NAD(P)-binding domain-containing protein n=1 Tax=Bacillus sp. FJAT-45350 TaxID=2011014 RepID=UPI000BB91242|nr:FAD/NAD(P)-binding protein [Bacillus sp. FJAT-45350]